MRGIGADRKGQSARSARGHRKRGHVLSFDDDFSGTEQVKMPIPLPAGAAGGNPKGQAGRSVAPLVVALIVGAWLLLRLAQGGSALLTQPEASLAPDAGLASADDVPHVDLDAIRAARLFSAPDSAVESPATRALAQLPAALPSSGAVQLEGIVLAADPAQSVAFIRSGGRQQAFRVGDSLADGALVLREVARDHVLLDRRGERLRLDLRNKGQQDLPASASAADLLAGVAAAMPRINQADLEGAMQKVNAAFDVSSLAEVIVVRPAQRNGRLVGYQLSPGVRLKEFVQLGLRTGDIVTAVNGIPLDDLDALQSLGSLMNGATEVSFSLLREGQVQNLRISLQALAASAAQSGTTNNMDRP